MKAVLIHGQVVRGKPCDAGETTRLSSHSTRCSFHVIQSAAVLRGDASRREQGVGLGSVERPHDDFGEERWSVRGKTLRWGGKGWDGYSRCR
jgi:hypothetical protein